MGDNPPRLRLFFNKQLRRRSDQLEASTRDVEEVGRGVGCAELPVDVKGMKGRRAGDAVGGDSLDYAALLNLCLEIGDVGLVAGLTNIRLIGLVELYMWLLGEGNGWTLKGCDQSFEDGGGGGILSIQEGVGFY